MALQRATEDVPAEDSAEEQSAGVSEQLAASFEDEHEEDEDEDSNDQASFYDEEVLEESPPFTRSEPRASDAIIDGHAVEAAYGSATVDEDGSTNDVHPSGRAERLFSTAVDSSSELKNRAIGAIVLGRDLVAQASTSAVFGGAFDAARGLIRAVKTGIGTAGATELDDYGKDERLSRSLSPLGSFIYEKYWRVNVTGADHVPSGRAILVANHSGALPFDGPVLHAALARERADLPESRWLVEDQVFYAPFLGTLLNRLGAVRACPENAVRLLEEQRPIIVFPEGIHGLSKSWRERYKLMRFGRGGFVKLALRTRAPIVPVAIVGAEESMPLLGRLPGKAFGVPYLPFTSPVPLPARWSIRFGRPINVDDLPSESSEDLALVRKLNDRTRDTVNGMLAALLKSRERVYV